MSDILAKAVEELSNKVSGGFDGSAKFVIDGEGAVMVDSAGVRAGDEEAEVILSASAETFEGMMKGDVNPTMAFMSGSLKIDGSMSEAMKLASILS